MTKEFSMNAKMTSLKVFLVAVLGMFVLAGCEDLPPVDESTT